MRERRIIEKKIRKVGRYIGYTSTGMLGILALLMLLPIVPADANAETLTAGLPTMTTVHLYSTISVSASNEVDIELTPKSGGTIEVGTADVVVATNNTTGYSIYLSTANGSNKLEQIKNTGASGFTDDGNSDYTINPLSGEVVKSAYLSNQSNYNTWGYALTTQAANDSTKYKGLTKPSGDAISSTNTTSSRDSYKLNVAVAVDTSLPAGSYRNGLVVSAVANPIQVSGFNKIMYMQEMTPAVCNEVQVGEASELVDKRDNTIYQVAKLADGHCWMTQNLALDLVAGATLTSADTDLANTETGSWTVPKSTGSQIPLPNTGDNSDTQSWNLGKLVLTKPTNSSLCPKQDPAVSGVAGQTYPNKDENNNAFTGQKIENTCSSQVIDVSNGWIADANHEGYSATVSIVEDATGKYYDPHYLFGNYYQWNAAVAGTGFTAEGANVTGTNATDANGAGLTNATGSICPKGWILPKAGRNTSATETIFGVGAGQSYDIDGSFYHLLKAYGYDSGWNANSGNGYMLINHADRTANLAGSPIYFVRSGNVNPYNGSLRLVGYYGYGWSSTAYPASNSYSYNLYFTTADVIPSYNTNRYSGFPVRCLAR